MVGHDISLQNYDAYLKLEKDARPVNYKSVWLSYIHENSMVYMN